MIVIGVDVHKHSLTAVAVDGVGRTLSEWTGPLGAELSAWARSLAQERLWALEDCRHVSRSLERLLVEAGERLVRVPPRLTAPARRRGRSRGKSDAIDALAVARAALREPCLDQPRPEEPLVRELKLLVDHRDDWSRSGGAGTCTSSIRRCGCPWARSTARSGSTDLDGSSPARSRRPRYGSHATCSSAAAL
jgi:Transposase